MFSKERVDLALIKKEHPDPTFRDYEPPLVKFKCIDRSPITFIEVYRDYLICGIKEPGHCMTNNLTHILIENYFIKKESFLHWFKGYCFNGDCKSNSLCFIQDKGFLKNIFRRGRIYTLEDIYDILKESWVD